MIQHLEDNKSGLLRPIHLSHGTLLNLNPEKITTNTYGLLRPIFTSKKSLEPRPEMEFKEFEPRFKSAKTRFKFSAGLNLETFDTILSGTNHI